jgi:hypothetical protein
MAIKYTKCPIIYTNILHCKPLRKCTPIPIFGQKINHVATLPPSIRYTGNLEAIGLMASYCHIYNATRVTWLVEFSPFGRKFSLASFFVVTKVALCNYWASFFHGTGYVFILTKKWLGYILSYFFTNSSGYSDMLRPNSKFFPSSDWTEKY